MQIVVMSLPMILIGKSFREHNSSKLSILSHGITCENTFNKSLLKNLTKKNAAISQTTVSRRDFGNRFMGIVCIGENHVK